MSALTALIARLHRAGVSYSAGPEGKLRVESPAGALSEEDWVAIKAHKEDLLFFAGGVTVYGRGREPAWMREEMAVMAERRRQEYQHGLHGRTEEAGGGETDDPGRTAGDSRPGGGAPRSVLADDTQSGPTVRV